MKTRKNLFTFIFVTCLLAFSNGFLFASETVGDKIDNGIEDVKHGAHKTKKKVNKAFKNGKKKVSDFFKD